MLFLLSITIRTLLILSIRLIFRLFFFSSSSQNKVCKETSNCHLNRTSRFSSGDLMLLVGVSRSVFVCACQSMARDTYKNAC